MVKEETRSMDEYDSGGGSGDKAPEAEEEGSTPPLPEKVVLIDLQIFSFFVVWILKKCCVSNVLCY